MTTQDNSASVFQPDLINMNSIKKDGSYVAIKYVQYESSLTLYWLIYDRSWLLVVLHLG